MRKNLFHTLLILMTVAALYLLAITGKAQPIPVIFNPDPGYWYNRAQAEHTENDSLKAEIKELKKSGRTAILGYQASLVEANKVIAQKDTANAVLTMDRNTESARAESLQKDLTDCQGKQPKTKAGKFIRNVGQTAKNVLAGTGAITIVVLAARAIVFF
ncbi:hypothetical protein GCM10028808_73370 [Spirosoma migulaei]